MFIQLAYTVAPDLQKKSAQPDGPDLFVPTKDHATLIGKKTNLSPPL